MSRTPIVAGNWKMNTTVDGAMVLVEDMLDDLDALDGVEIVLCPPFINLVPVSDMLAESTVALGAQNMFWEEKGAFTGEVSPLMLQPLCKYVILGHSERRQYFGETDETVKKRVLAALSHDLLPIVCVGENQAQRDEGQSLAVVDRQMRAVFEGMTAEQALKCVVAYEPVWAIGTGRAATGAIAEEIIGAIRELLGELFGAEVAAEIRIQYGGSVTAANAGEFFGEADIDGALVGGASLKPAEFVGICAAAQRAKFGR